MVAQAAGRAIRLMVSPVHSSGETHKMFVEFARTRDERLRDELVEAYLGLAHQLARRFTNRGETYEDLVQVASIALIKSVERFDLDVGVEFSTYATRNMLGELKRHFRDNGWAVRAPRRIQELYLELGQSIESLSQELGRPPTISEMARITGATEEAVLEAMEAGQSYRTSSIDAPDGHDSTIASRLGELDSSFVGSENRMVLALSLPRLPDRERTILKLRFVDGLTQSQIASEMGISQMHVSRLLNSSLAKLREVFVTES
jgi:RNA polymerase sigma-B factor